MDLSGTINIGVPVLSCSDSTATYRVPVHGLRSDALWYTVGARYVDMIDLRSDPAVLALLLPAMRSGRDMHIRGTVTDELLYQLQRGVQDILIHTIPGLTRIAITADEMTSPTASSGACVATGFSGGVDSFMTLRDYWLSDEVPKSLRLTHLLFNNVGSHYQSSREFIRRRLARVNRVARHVGIPLIAVDSNLTDFYGGWRFLETHPLRNASVGVLLQGSLRRWLYSMAHPYTSIQVRMSVGAPDTDALLLPMLSSPALDLRPVGGERGRVAKTLALADVEIAWSNLDVCTKLEYRRNCSTCAKCMRTQLTLEIGGVLDRFADSFDLDRYLRVRSAFIAKVIRSSEPFDRDIVQYARESRHRFSRAEVGRGQFLRVAKRIARDGSRFWSRVGRRG